MIDNYKKQVERTGSSKDELKVVKTEVAQGVKRELEASIGVNVPGIPVGLNAAFKYKNY